jgi:DnaJ-class molecular chaperone
MVRIKISLPKKLNDKQRKLLKELAAMEAKSE